jgi:hypothetical protein
LCPFPREAYTDSFSALRLPDFESEPRSLRMLHPCPTQSACMGILASSPSLLSRHSISPTRPVPSQRGQIRLGVSRLDPIQHARPVSHDPSPPGRSESVGLIRVVRRDPSRLPRSEPTRTDPSLCPTQNSASPSSRTMTPFPGSEFDSESTGSHDGPQVTGPLPQGGQRLQSHR